MGIHNNPNSNSYSGYYTPPQNTNIPPQPNIYYPGIQHVAPTLYSEPVSSDSGSLVVVTAIMPLIRTLESQGFIPHPLGEHIIVQLSSSISNSRDYDDFYNQCDAYLNSLSNSMHPHTLASIKSALINEINQTKAQRPFRNSYLGASNSLDSVVHLIQNEFETWAQQQVFLDPQNSSIMKSNIAKQWKNAQTAYGPDATLQNLKDLYRAYLASARSWFKKASDQDMKTIEAQFDAIVSKYQRSYIQYASPTAPSFASTISQVQKAYEAALNKFEKDGHLDAKNISIMKRNLTTIGANAQSIDDFKNQYLSFLSGAERRFATKSSTIKQQIKTAFEHSVNQHLSSRSSTTTTTTTTTTTSSSRSQEIESDSDDVEEVLTSDQPFDSTKWTQEFAKTNADKKKLRIDVWKSTEKATTAGFTVGSSQVKLNTYTTGSMKSGTKLFKYDASDMYTIPLNAPKHETKVRVKNSDTIDAIKKLNDKGFNTVGMNMANESKAGGGYKNGAGAQEESIFRRSNYHESLEVAHNPALAQQMPHNSYVIPEFGNIFTPNLQVFRRNEEKGYAFCNPFTVNMVAVAAYSANSSIKSVQTKSFDEGMKEKIRNFLRTAHRTGHDAVVLGALGCGAFKNDPAKVAKLYKQVLKESEFKRAFKKVVFAIIDDHNGKNLDPFKQALKKLIKKS